MIALFDVQQINSLSKPSV